MNKSEFVLEGTTGTPSFLCLAQESNGPKSLGAGESYP